MKFADVLHQMGATLLFGQDFITVMAPLGDEKLKAIDISLNDMPDMAQTLATVALFADGQTIIRDIGTSVSKKLIAWLHLIANLLSSARLSKSKVMTCISHRQ